MIRFIAILGIFLVGVWIYCMVDAITSDAAEVRQLPKALWVLIVVVAPVLGALAWLAVGRPVAAPRGPRLPRPGYRGPEDDPEFWSR
jgi:hypothetical protein